MVRRSWALSREPCREKPNGAGLYLAQSAGPVQVRASVVAGKRRSKTPWSQGMQEGRCEKEQMDERENQTGTSARAKSAAKPAGAILLRWKWVERSVWTDRMLTTLEEGIKGGKGKSNAYADQLGLWRLAVCPGKHVNP